MTHKKEWQEENNLCKDCLHCRIKRKEIFCRKGYFDKINVEKPILMTPYDFDCSQGDFFQKLEE